MTDADGYRFPRVAAQLDALDEPAIRAGVAARSNPDPKAAALWLERYGFTQADARAARAESREDKLRVAYLGCLIATRTAPYSAGYAALPEERRRSNPPAAMMLAAAGYEELAVQVFRPEFGSRWYDGDYMWEPETDVEDIVRLWQLRDTAPPLLASFDGELARSLPTARRIRQLLDALLKDLDPGAALVAAVEYLNGAPARPDLPPDASAADVFDIDGAVRYATSTTRP